MGCTNCCCFCMPPFFRPPTGGSTPGPVGPPGPAGKDGADGLSAYEIAVKNGFVGTEKEWLLSLKGEKGDPGFGGVTKGIQMQLTKNRGGIITSGSNILFDSLLTDNTTGLQYNQDNGEWTIIEPGLYEIHYIVNVQSSQGQAQWSIIVDGVSSNPPTTQSNQLTGQVLIQVSNVPYPVKLELSGGTNLTLSDQPIQADIIILQHNQD